MQFHAFLSCFFDCTSTKTNYCRFYFVTHAVSPANFNQLKYRDIFFILLFHSILLFSIIIDICAIDKHTQDHIVHK